MEIWIAAYNMAPTHMTIIVEALPRMRLSTSANLRCILQPSFLCLDSPNFFPESDPSLKLHSMLVRVARNLSCRASMRDPPTCSQLITCFDAVQCIPLDVRGEDHEVFGYSNNGIVLLISDHFNLLPSSP
jgi:hypothetical protein